MKKAIHSFFVTKGKLDRLRAVLLRNNGGIYKRILENRELYHLLQNRCPELLEECFWIKGWLDSQDQFLRALEGALKDESPTEKNGAEHRNLTGELR